MAKKHDRDYLYQKAGESTWYVRIVVPVDVRPAFGNRRTLTKTTGTSNKAEALVARLPILAAWKHEIQLARQQKLENADRWREQLHNEAKLSERSLTRNVMKVVTGRRRYYAEEDVDKIMATLAPFMAEGAESLKNSGADAELVDQIPRLVREKFLARGNEAISKAQELNSLLRQTALQTTAYEYQLSSAEQAEASIILANPKSYKPRSPITKAMLDQWSTHLESQIATAKTRDMHRNRVQRLSDWLTKEGRKLDFDSVHAFIESVSSSRTTRQNYLWSGRDFWKWACKYHQGFRDQFSSKPCPFDGHALPRAGKAAGESYVAFTKEQVEALHAKALSLSNQPLADLIQLAAYTGARLEEIGRISIENTTFKDGKPKAFKIEQAKTSAGVREIPIHSQLQPVYQRLLETAQKNGGHLLAGGKNKYGNRLDYLSKQFGRLKVAEGYDSRHVFHSIRKTTTTELHRARMTMEVIPWILGHESDKSFTLDVYSAGPSFEQKQEAIEALKFNFQTK